MQDTNKQEWETMTRRIDKLNQISEIKDSKIPVIFLESVHRIEKALDQLGDCPKQLIVGRELTKQFETIYRGTAQEILAILNSDKTKVKGEFIVIVNKKK